MLIFDQLKRSDPHLRALSLTVLTGLGVLLGGLWYLQVIVSRRYVHTQKIQSVRTVRIPAIRGKILDRNGVPLADNRPSYNLSLYVEELSRQFQAEYRRLSGGVRLSRKQQVQLAERARYTVVSNVVARLGLVLREPLRLDEAQFLKHYTNRLALPLPILENLNPEQVALFQEQPNKPPGLELEVQPLRFYPYGQVAAHLLGYLRYLPEGESVDYDELDSRYSLPDYKGVMGVEGKFDEELRGRAGIKSVLVNSIGYRQSEDTWFPADPGTNLVLTIDLRIQEAAERALRTVGRTVRGAVVVMDPRNGDVLALVSLPAYDPNEFIPRLSAADWQKLTDPELRPQVNRATAENYSPGSTFKIVVALAGLESGTLKPEEIYHNLGSVIVGRHRFGDLAKAGDYDFRKAFKESSNSYFIEHGLRAGIQSILEIGRRFHFGERTGIPILQETSGLLPSPEWKEKTFHEGWRPGDTANVSIGQGYLDVTPLQMAVMTSAIANGGKVFWPRLVRQLEAPDAGGLPPVQGFVPGRLRDELGVRPQFLDIIREGMLADVEEEKGTGRSAFVPGMRICGKTGTAQVKQGGILKRHDTWFVSYADYDNPRYVVVVMDEGGGSGGGTSAPVARRIYEVIHKIETAPAPRNGVFASANHFQP
ncbi:MAG: penicillin-binding protein 2 [Verrucomicrobia bacterium]|nr:penicillin-binding protein 2 [Verrucomicrobiota bacterium]